MDEKTTTSRHTIARMRERAAGQPEQRQAEVARYAAEDARLRTAIAELEVQRQQQALPAIEALRQLDHKLQTLRLEKAVADDRHERTMLRDAPPRVTEMLAASRRVQVVVTGLRNITPAVQSRLVGACVRVRRRCESLRLEATPPARLAIELDEMQRTLDAALRGLPVDDETSAA